MTDKWCWDNENLLIIMWIYITNTTNYASLPTLITWDRQLHFHTRERELASTMSIIDERCCSFSFHNFKRLSYKICLKAVDISTMFRLWWSNSMYSIRYWLSYIHKQNCETCLIGQWLMCMSIEMRNQSDIVTF